MGKIENLKGKLQHVLGRESSGKEPFQISQRQAIILATGMEFHADGIPWWRGIDMVNTLQEREVVSDFSRMSVYADFGILQREALIQAAWIHEEREKLSRKYRVTDEGSRERSKVDIRNVSNESSSSNIPIPESH